MQQFINIKIDVLIYNTHANKMSILRIAIISISMCIDRTKVIWKRIRSWNKSTFTWSKFSSKTWSKFFDRKFVQRKLCQSYPVDTIKVWLKFDQSFYPKLPLDDYSKINKMAELDLDSEKMFWLVNSNQSPSKFLEK